MEKWETDSQGGDGDGTTSKKEGRVRQSKIWAIDTAGQTESKRRHTNGETADTRLLYQSTTVGTSFPSCESHKYHRL